MDRENQRQQKNLPQSFPFHVSYVEATENIQLSFFDIEDVEQASNYIDAHVVTIYGGPTCEDNVEIVKQRIARLFKKKMSNRNWLFGATAEFFSHLFLNHYGYRQDCLYSNLEERSIKKGFDGLYSSENKMWLMESKSGDGSSGTTHIGKFHEAMADLKNKLSNTELNDPWENALYHARLADSNETIIKKITALSDAYVMGQGSDIAEYNVIPCATVYYAGECPPANIDIVTRTIAQYFSNRNHESVHVVCASNATLDGFLNYLGLGENK